MGDGRYAMPGAQEFRNTEARLNKGKRKRFSQATVLDRKVSPWSFCGSDSSILNGPDAVGLHMRGELG